MGGGDHRGRGEGVETGDVVVSPKRKRYEEGSVSKVGPKIFRGLRGQNGGGGVVE